LGEFEDLDAPKGLLKENKMKKQQPISHQTIPFLVG
jgi:hypothetical protein